MILYWARPDHGAGHATRAAAICRWLDTDVTVIRGSDNPAFNRALDEYQIPYVVYKSEYEAVQFVKEVQPRLCVMDAYPKPMLRKISDVCIWRIGRGKPVDLPTIAVEGPDSLFPVLLLKDDEILTREASRDALGLSQDDEWIFGVRSSGWRDCLKGQNHNYVIEEWPALKYLRGADHVIGAMGANLYAEVRYLDLPVTWRYSPNSMDQSLRKMAEPSGPIQRDAAQRVAMILDDHHRNA